MPLYNLSQLQNSTGIVDLILAANNAYPQGYGDPPQLLLGGIIISIWVVFVFLLRKHDIIDSIMASSFVCFILSIFFRMATGLNFMYILAFGFIIAVSGFIKIVQGKKV